MPSIFSWRPTKLQIRLKKLSHQLGTAAGNASNIGYNSSDEDEDDEPGQGTHEEKKRIMGRQIRDGIEPDFVVDSAPPVTARRPPAAQHQQQLQQTSLSDDEYFYARSPAANRCAKPLGNGLASADSAKNDDDSIHSSLSSTKRRAVRFSEESSVVNGPRTQQPPVCNVAPTSFANPRASPALAHAAPPPTILLNNGEIPPNSSLQFRALTSPTPSSGSPSTPNAAALPPRYSPLPAAGKSSGFHSPPGSGQSVDGPSVNWQRGFSNMMMVESASENEASGDFEEHENRRPPRPARSSSAHNGARNRANILLQQLRSDSDVSASDSSITVPQNSSNRQRVQYSPHGAPNSALSPASESNSGVIFLEFNDEVKRSSFPPNIHSLEQIKGLFLRTFSNLSLDYLNLPYVKIYIQESTKSHLFYELDDIKDVKNHSLLKIREQQHHRNFQSPPPMRFIDPSAQGQKPGLPIVDYLSEPEMEYGNVKDTQRYRYYNNSYGSGGGGRGGAPYSQRGYAPHGIRNAANFDDEQQRPASVLPGIEDASRTFLHSGQYPRSPLHFQADQRNRQNLMSPITTSTRSLPLPRMGAAFYGNSPEPSTPSYLANNISAPSAASLASSSSGGSHQHDPYYDPYYSSDSSSRHSRSGSSTPIMMMGGQGGAGSSPGSLPDEETRQRVDTMERQLAGLSTLVHSALITRDMNPSVRQEMMQLQRQILELQTPSSTSAATPPSGALKSVGGESKAPTDEELTNLWLAGATHGAAHNGGKRASLLQKIRREAQNTRDELRQLRRQTQTNAQTSQDVLRQAAQRIRAELKNLNGLNHSQSSLMSDTKSIDKWSDENLKLETLRKTHLEKLGSLQNSLRMFELSVEEIRGSVLNSNRKLRMTEVEQLTNSLTQIGKNSAVLKTRFPELQTEVEKEIRRYMENIVREENFIKEEREQVDECLRRCKNLANMMVTMKKLAMVQDPALKGMSNGVKAKNGGILNNVGPGTVPTAKLTGVATTIQNGSATTVGPKPALVKKPTESVDEDMTKPNVLDNILDELNFSPVTSKKAISNESSLNNLSSHSPPKPPERKRYNTTEIRLIYEKENGIAPSRLRASGSLDMGDPRLKVTSSTESVDSQEGMRAHPVILHGKK